VFRLDVNSGDVVFRDEMDNKQVNGRLPITYSGYLILYLAFSAIGCHGNSVPYRHPSAKTKKISVDKIVTLETVSNQGDKVLKIGIENIPSKNYDIEANTDNDVELDNTSELEDKANQPSNTQLVKLIKDLRKELEDVRLNQDIQR